MLNGEPFLGSAYLLKHVSVHFVNLSNSVPSWGLSILWTLPKGDRAPKKQKVSLEPVVGLMAESTKTVTPAKHEGSKGLMIPPPGSQKKPPILLREDPKYALEKLSSIISNEDYEDLGNHSTEAKGETSLFSIAQVRVHRTLACIYSLFETNSFLFRPCS